MMWWILAGCGPAPVVIGDFIVTVDRRDGEFAVRHTVLNDALTGVRIGSGTGSADVTMEFGSFLFENESEEIVWADRLTRPRGRGDLRQLTAEAEDGTPLGELSLSATAGGPLRVSFAPAAGNRQVFSADCTTDDHFLGTGGHQLDVDHVGEAYKLWVSEPGIGKVDSEEPPDDWFFRGTRHATSTPIPFFVRPHLGQGLWVDTDARLDLDFCHTDTARFSTTAWSEEPVTLNVFQEASPAEAVRRFRQDVGPWTLPEPWVFGVWLTAVRGSDRVREVASRARDFGVPATVIWTEDWRGASDTIGGYRLGPEWFLDTSLYPDAAELAVELEDNGFKWFSYFSPFLWPGSQTWDEAMAADVVVKNAAGEPYTFFGAALTETGLIDLSTEAGQQFAIDRMRANLELGFDGWMADFAEWLPTDAVLGNGEDAAIAHNQYPVWWQQVNAKAQAGADATFFARSAWTETTKTAPVLWGGDQETDFEPHDGLPSVVTMGLNLAASGMPVFTHDIAGYSSQGAGPSTKELWFRWASLGAFTPIMRLHHGSEDLENWQFDSDEETTRHFAAMAREHMRLWPYRYGLAARAARDGTPMLQPIGFVAPTAWDRTDGWMLGDALLVAPVLEEGATERDVDLPEGNWYDWWTAIPATSGPVRADMDEIPVFVRGGSIVPVFSVIPETLFPNERELVDLEMADRSRTLLVFDSNGFFEEADGTTYRSSGTPTGLGAVTETLVEGTIEVSGVAVRISGNRERTYTVVVTSQP